MRGTDTFIESYSSCAALMHCYTARERLAVIYVSRAIPLADNHYGMIARRSGYHGRTGMPSDKPSRQ